MAWHLKHRPHTIAELHLKEVREMFQQYMKQGRFPQVLLFAGPKGTGKTSTSRIIGVLLNDPANEAVVDHLFFGKKAPKSKQLHEPATDTEFARLVYGGNSFVVQEMDAASYRGIDDVRALKERVMLPPQQGKIAVYILDEAHMFTTEAFNALLKLLEEPPAHAVFILATTELHKIPATIASRATKVDFRKATHEELLAALENVAKKEKLKYQPEALARVAEQADGSFRDAVKLLELVAGSGTVSMETVESALGSEVDTTISQLIQAVVQKDSEAVLALITDLRARNVHEVYFYKTLFSALHRALMQGLGAISGEPLVAAKVARFLLQELLKADLQRLSPVPFLALELKLLEIIERAQQQNGTAPTAKKKIIKLIPELLDKVPTREVVMERVDTASPDSAEKVPTMTIAPQIDEDIQALGKSLVEQWERFLQLVQERNATLAALLRSSKPVLTAEGIPQVGVFYKFHQEQLQQQKYMTLIQDCARDVVGTALPLVISLQRPPQGAALVEVEEVAENLAELAEEALL